MSRKIIGSIVAALLTLSAAAVAQMQGGPVTRVYVNRVKSGMEQQYEAGRKKHMAWHRSQNDTWSWYVYQVLTGENTGSYVVVTPGHNWKDFDGRDQFEKADAADAAANLGPSQASSTLSYYVNLPNLARPAPGEASAAAQAPAPYVTVLSFRLSPEGVPDFIAAVKKITEGMTKTNYPYLHSEWFSLANGGQGPEFVLVSDRRTFADMQPPEKTLDAMMQEAFGDEGAAVMKSVRNSYRSTYTELLQYRPDLSYVPAGK